jgi:uncharacterized protein YecT (DUF1311 family)
MRAAAARAAMTVVAALAATGPAVARQDCGQMATQLDANVCARGNWEESDAALNRLWKVVKPAADARGTGAALLADQRGWLARRDGECAAQRDSYAGGSIADMVFWTCMDDMTRARNAELEGVR